MLREQVVPQCHFVYFVSYFALIKLKCLMS